MIRKDYIYTLLTQFIVLFSFLITYKLIAIYFGDISFEVFSFLKRYITFVIAIIGFGLYTSIVRFNSISRDESLSILKSSFLFSIIVLASLLFLIKIDNHFFRVFFAEYHLAYDTVLAAFCTLSGMYLHNIVYAYFRGLSFAKANSFELISKALAPFLSIFMAKSLEEFFMIHGIYQILISSIVYVYINKFKLPIKYSEFTKNLQKLLSFGIRRVASDLGLNILLFLPLIYISDSSISGILAFSITLLTVVGYFFSPLGIILLPKIAKLLHDEEYEKSRAIILYSLIASILTASFITMIFYFFNLQILLFFISKLNNIAVMINYSIIFIILPYIVFLIGKNIIDAYYRKGVNSINVTVSIVIFFICNYVCRLYFTDVESVICSFVASMVTLGTLTFSFLINIIYKLNKYDI